MPVSILPCYDLFISYSVLDRQAVEALSQSLKERGLRVWYAREELIPGKDIYDTVSYGLKSSRFGIALISPNYKGKWTMGELFELKKRKHRLIPVLHNMSINEGIALYPELADIYFLNTAMGDSNLAVEVERRVKKLPFSYYLMAQALDKLQKNRRLLLKLSAGGLIMFLLLFLLARLDLSYPSDKFIQAAVNERILSFEDQIKKNLQDNLIRSGGKKSSFNEIQLANQKLCPFESAQSMRNRFEFSNGHEKIHSIAGLKNSGVIAALGSPEPPFGIRNSRIYLLAQKTENDSCELKYSIVNEEPAGYRIEKKEYEKGILKVLVHYTDVLRYAEVVTVYSFSTHSRSRLVSLSGFKERETYLFVKKDKEWVLSAIQ